MSLVTFSSKAPSRELMKKHQEAYDKMMSVRGAEFDRAYMRHQVKDHEGRPAKVKFNSRLDYVPFRMKEDAPAVRRAAAAVRAIGREPNLRVTNGGLDANWMVKHGIPTVTFGAGQNEIHTVKEFVDLSEFESGCRLALALAAGEE